MHVSKVHNTALQMAAGDIAVQCVCIAQLTTREESFDVFIDEADGGVAIWELLLASAIGKQHSPAAIHKNLLHLAIWVAQLLQDTPWPSVAHSDTCFALLKLDKSQLDICC